jgi:hypothetical protein
MDDDQQADYEYMAPEVQAARDTIAKAIAHYMLILRPTEQPYMVAWTVACEWTNTELEQSGRAGRDTISPSEQTISATVGLGQYTVNRYA